MLVAVTGLGSIWKCHRARDSSGVNRFTRGAVFYDTTGVAVSGVVRPRSRIYGVARFHCVSGFPAHNPERVLHKVFECTDPCSWRGENRIVFRGLARPGERDANRLSGRSSLRLGRVDRRDRLVARGQRLRALVQSIVQPAGGHADHAAVFLAAQYRRPVPSRAGTSRSSRQARSAG